jgi:hypothetical protein
VPRISNALRAFVIVTSIAITCCSLPRLGEAQELAGDRDHRGADDLDGVYLMLGPLSTISYTEDTWQGAFGGLLLAVLVRERARLSSLGLAIGGLRYTTLDGGRVWADALVGSRIAGVHVGLTFGATARADGITPPRLGAQATFWLFAGLVPYLRVGAIERDGAFVELGLQLVLPALRL